MAYTYRPSGSILEKIVRYEYDGEKLVDEFVLLDNIQGNTTHDGCRLIILPDNTLLFSTGDAQNLPAAQNLSHLSGKFLRLNLDGSIPSDNPFPDNPVYSYGHRNAQGLYLAPNGIIYSSEHGPNTDDELNIIEPGRNYGWPNVRGYCDTQAEIEFCDENNVVEPIEAWTPTTAVSDIIYYDHPAIPEWKDKILLTTLKNKRLYVMELSEDGTEVIGEEQLFTNWWGRLRDVCMDPEGAIYLATNGPSWSNTEPFTHSIIKVWNPEFVSVGERAESNNRFSVYPNPANDFLTIASNDFNGEMEAKVFGVAGNLLITETVNQPNQSLSISGLSEGVYVITLSQGGEILFSDRFFVVRR
jgi:glucose/arabinose dehydrogenase